MNKKSRRWTIAGLGLITALSFAGEQHQREPTSNIQNENDG